MDEKPFCEECYAVSKMVGKDKAVNHGDLGEGRRSVIPIVLAVHGRFSWAHFEELYCQLMRATCVNYVVNFYASLTGLGQLFIIIRGSRFQINKNTNFGCVG